MTEYPSALASGRASRQDVGAQCERQSHSNSPEASADGYCV